MCLTKVERMENSDPPVETSNGEAGSKVNVAVRVRPFIARENSETEKWNVTRTELVSKSDGTAYPYDYVFGKQTKTKALYDEVVAPIVNKSFSGFNGTILCYGQTSSGKTHTLYGNDADKGIISLFAEHLFDQIQNDQGRKEYSVRAGVIEIYNEKFSDLLNAENRIDIQEKNGVISPVGHEEFSVVKSVDLIKIAEQAQSQRKTGGTLMNTESSQSHTVLRVTIEIIDVSTPFTEVAPCTTSVLHFVDLAGSEKQSQTGAEGQRLVEAININKPLLPLSLVINQLRSNSSTDEQKFSQTAVTDPRKDPRPRFVNFRDSKLTRLLQSTLNGEAFISLICNVTIANEAETKSTLQFASRAKSMEIQPKKNYSSASSEFEKKINELRELLLKRDEENDRLQKRLERLQKFYPQKDGFNHLPEFEYERYHDQAGQTDASTSAITPKKNKNIGTPVATLRVGNSLLNGAYENFQTNNLEQLDVLEKENRLKSLELEEVQEKYKKSQVDHLASAIKANEECKNQLEALKKQFETQSYNQLKMDLKIADAEIKDLKQSLQKTKTLGDDFKKSQADLEITKRTIYELKDQLAASQETTLKYIQLKSDFEKANAELIDTKESLEKAKFLEDDYRKSQADLKIAAQDIKEFKTQLEAMKKQLEASKMNSERHSQLSEDLERANAELIIMKQSLEKAKIVEGHFGEAQAELTKAYETINETKNQLAASQEIVHNCTQLKSELEKANDELITMKQSLEKAKIFGKAQAELTKAYETIDEMKNQLVASEEIAHNYTQVKSDLERANYELEEIKEKYKKSQADLASAIKTKEECFNELQFCVKQLELTVENKNRTEADFEMYQNVVKDEIKENLEKVQEMRKDYSKSEVELRIARGIIDELKHQLAASQETNVKYIQLKSDFEKANAELVDTKQRLEDLLREPEMAEPTPEDIKDIISRYDYYLKRNHTGQ